MENTSRTYKSLSKKGKERFTELMFKYNYKNNEIIVNDNILKHIFTLLKKENLLPGDFNDE